MSIDEYRAEAEDEAGSRLSQFADFLAERKKALTALVSTTILPFVTDQLGADSKVTVGLVAVASVLGVYAVANRSK